MKRPDGHAPVLANDKGRLTPALFSWPADAACAARRPRGARIVENARHMLVPHRFSVLASAVLAVASPFVAGAMARSHAGGAQHGFGYMVLYWPMLLLDRLPEFASVLRTSALHIVLLYFAGYLLAWFLASNLVAAIVRRLRSTAGTSSDEH